MRKKNGLEILTDEIAIPEIVQKRAQEAFDQIRREAEREDPKIMMLSDEREERMEKSGSSQRRRRRKTRRSVSAAILTAVLIIGAMSTVAMAAFRGSLVDSLKEMFHISDEQEEALLNREDGLVHIIESEQHPAGQEETKETEKEIVSETTEAEETTEEDIFSKAGDVTSVTVNGVTVKLTQAMVDQFYVCAAVQAEGIPYVEGKDISFETVRVGIVDMERAGSMSGSIENNEPGTIDFDFSFRPRGSRALGEDQPGWFFGKQMQVTLTNIVGFINPKEPEQEEILVEGQWVLTWTMEGTEESHTYEVNQPLGKTGATVETITLSPLSVEVCYDNPRKSVTLEVEGGGSASEWKDPPMLEGVLLKDGTILRGVTSMTRQGYDSGEGNTYRATSKMLYILDPDEIESFLFLKKTYTDKNHEYVLEDFYVVPVTE